MFTNTNVLITGGGSGIGQATAIEFFKLGAFVTIIDNSFENIEKMRQAYPEIKIIAADVSCYESIRKAFDHFDRENAKLDILIANAGISIRHPFVEITFDEWRRVMGVNLDGAFFCAQFAAKRMLAQKSGVILFTASTNGIKAHSYYADYNASKAALILLAKTMALELAPFIRVNAVAPGYVLTPMQLAEYTSEMLEEVNNQLPLRRHAAPQEIANLFTFLASDNSTYITGQVISIDGGETV